MSDFLAKQSLFGGQLSTDDMSAMYLQQLQQLNNIKFSKAAYDDAKKLVESNKGLNEFAVTGSGHLVVQNMDSGELTYLRPEELKEKISNGENLNPLRNTDLLNLRAYSKSFDNGLLDVVSNGVGIEKIGEFIKAQLPKIESNESSIEGYTKHETNQIKKGLELLAEAPTGDYKYTIKDKTNREQAEQALKYLRNILPTNMKTILETHAQLQGTSLNQMLATLVSSNISTTHDISFDAVTGKAAKDANGNSKGGMEGDIKSNPIMQMIQQQGGVPRTWNLITRDSNTKMSVDGTFYSQIPKIKEDTSLDKMLSESGIGGILDSKQGITFGDQNISPDQFKDIMYSNSGGMIVTLPCKFVNGHKEVNLGIKETYEKALQEVESKGISKNSPEYSKVLGEILKQKGLNSLLDSNGYPDKNKFGQFLLVEAYTTDKIKNFDTSSQYIEKVKNPDAQLEERMIRALSTDDKKSNYSLDIDYWLWGDDVYRGTVFIPLTNNLNASINAWGDQVKIDESRDLENRFQNFNKASTMKSSNSNVL